MSCVRREELLKPGYLLQSTSRTGAFQGGGAGAPEQDMAAAPGPASSRRFSGTQWHMQNIANDSVESSDDEFFDAREEVVEGKSAILIGMSQWNSNDLVEQIETIGKLEDSQGELYRVPQRKQRCPRQNSMEIHEDSEVKVFRRKGGGACLPE